MGQNSIPSEPRLVFRGKLQSAQFTAGALMMRDVLRKIESIADGGHDQQDAATIADLLELTLTKPAQGELHRGAMLALADWLALHAWADEDASSWEPLASSPIYTEVKGHDCHEPPPLATFFVVGGAPVSVQPDRGCFVYDVDDYKEFDIDAVKVAGVPITRAQFNALRCVAPKLPTYDEQRAAAEHREAA